MQILLVYEGKWDIQTLQEKKTLHERLNVKETEDVSARNNAFKYSSLQVSRAAGREKLY